MVVSFFLIHNLHVRRVLGGGVGALLGERADDRAPIPGGFADDNDFPIEEPPAPAANAENSVCQRLLGGGSPMWDSRGTQGAEEHCSRGSARLLSTSWTAFSGHSIPERRNGEMRAPRRHLLIHTLHLSLPRSGPRVPEGEAQTGAAPEGGTKFAKPGGCCPARTFARTGVAEEYEQLPSRFAPLD